MSKVLNSQFSKFYRAFASVPLVSLAFAQCGAFATLWTGWRIITLFLPSRFYHLGDDFLFEKYQQLIIFLMENCSGIRLQIYGDYDKVLEKEEKVLWISNHQSAADWLVCEMVALKQGALRGVRYILKDTIKYVPLFGWYFPQHNCVYVRRSKNPKDVSDISNQLQHYCQNKMPVWLVIFPEGTRFNPEKPGVVEKSQNYARSLSLPELKYHLTPRVKATMISIEQLRDYVDAIYDVTIGYEETLLPSNLAQRRSINFFDFLVGFYRRVHVKVNRIDIRDAPVGEKETQVWLHNLFVEKDQTIEGFYSSDMSVARRFSGKSVCPPRSTFATTSSLVFWFASTSAFLCCDTGTWVWTRSWLGILSVGLLYAVFKR